MSTGAGTSTLHERCVLQGHKGSVNVARFNHDGKYCLTGGDDRRVLLWNPYKEPSDEIAPIKEYAIHSKQVLDVAVAHDNASFASCGGDKTVFVWDVGSGRVLRRLVGHDQRVNAVAYAGTDCSVLISASYDKTVRCWDCRSRNAAPIQVLADHADSVSSVAVCGHEIVTGSIDGCVRSYDLRVGKVTCDRLGQAVTHVTLSHDSNCVLAGCLDARLRLLDKSSGQLLNEYAGHENSQYKLGCCLSHDDALVLCGSEEGSLHVWDLVEAKQVLKLRAHRRAVGMVCCHPTRHDVLTASHDGTAKLWTPDAPS